MQVKNQTRKQCTEVRQASLVEAALRLAALKSPAEVSTTDLARAVGITQGAVFRHFASKEAIWLAALDWVTSTLIQSLQTAAQDALTHVPVLTDDTPKRPYLAALQAVFLTHVQFVVSHPGVPRVIFQELQQPGDSALKARVRGLMQHYRQVVMPLLTQAQNQHEISPQTSLPSAAVLFIGAVQGLVMQSLMSGDLSDMTRQAPGVYAIFQRGLLADNPSLTKENP